MIEVNGFKVFRGTMRITPIPSTSDPFEVRGNWLYRPKYDRWYGCGMSIEADNCEIVEDET